MIGRKRNGKGEGRLDGRRRREGKVGWQKKKRGKGWMVERIEERKMEEEGIVAYWNGMVRAKWTVER